jgi:hypothetical protein
MLTLIDHLKIAELGVDYTLPGFGKNVCEAGTQSLNKTWHATSLQLLDAEPDTELQSDT